MLPVDTHCRTSSSVTLIFATVDAIFRKEDLLTPPPRKLPSREGCHPTYMTGGGDQPHLMTGTFYNKIFTQNLCLPGRSLFRCSKEMNPVVIDESIPPANQGGLCIRHHSEESFDITDQDSDDDFHFMEESHPVQVII